MKIYRSLKTNIISQRFGENLNNFYAQLGMKGHNGIDFSAQDGENIYFDTGGRGTVVKISLSPTAGFGITIDDEQYRHIYWHLKEIKVKVGQVVESGDLIATADNTGLYTTGTHLHRGLYEIKDGKVINEDNGFGGAIDIAPYLVNIYIKDYMDTLNAQIGLIQKIIETIKAILKVVKTNS